VGYSYIPLFGFVKNEWNGMECYGIIPSDTTHSFNFPFHPIWGVSNGMEHTNNKRTNLSLVFLKFNCSFSPLIFSKLRFWPPKKKIQNSPLSFAPVAVLALKADIDSVYADVAP